MIEWTGLADVSIEARVAACVEVRVQGNSHHGIEIRRLDRFTGFGLER